MRKLSIRMLYISLFTVVLCGSCTESSEFTLTPQGETPEIKPAVTVYPTAIRASADGGSFEVAVAANSAWQVTAGSSSCKLSPALGSADEHAFTIEVAPNESDTPLDVKITVTATNSEGSATETITLTQENKPSKPEVKYGIASLKDMLAFAKAVNNNESLEPWTDPSDGVIKLLADIDMDGVYGWPAIGYRNGETKTPFKGTFDGNGFKIKNLTIQQSSDNLSWYFGLFGYNSGTIRNIVIDGGHVTSSSTNLAAVCGWNNDTGIIENCSSSASVTSIANPDLSSNTGGIVGYNQGTITNCSTLAGGLIKGANRAGGIAGLNDIKTVSDCTNRMNVIAGEMGGGIIAYNSGLVRNCVNYAAVTNSTQKYAVGIVAYNNFNAAILNCTNHGNIENEGSYAAGVAGINWGTVTDCVNRGSISNVGLCAAGLVAQNNNYITGTATRNYGNVSGKVNFAGGITAYNGSEAGIADAKNEGDIKPTNPGNGCYAGGISGVSDSSESATDPTYLERCENSGAIGGTAIFVGGILARGNPPITACVNKGLVSGGRYTGGILGYGSTAIKITGCGNEGDVTGTASDNQAGGIIGYGSSGKYTGCSNSGKVTSAGTDAGGISGYGQGVFDNCTNSGTITCQREASGGIVSRLLGSMANCKNHGDIIGGGALQYAGGLAGIRNSSATATSCTHDGSVNGVRPGPEFGKVLY